MAIEFEHVDVFDGTDVSIHQTVLIDGPVITATSRSVEIPADAMLRVTTEQRFWRPERRH